MVYHGSQHGSQLDKLHTLDGLLFIMIYHGISWYIMVANMVANLINSTLWMAYYLSWYIMVANNFLSTLWMAKSIGPQKKTSQHNVAGAPADAPAAPAAVALARSRCMQGLGPRGCQEQKWSHPIPAEKRRGLKIVR